MNDLTPKSIKAGVLKKLAYYDLHRLYKKLDLAKDIWPMEVYTFFNSHLEEEIMKRTFLNVSLFEKWQVLKLLWYQTLPIHVCIKEKEKAFDCDKEEFQQVINKFGNVPPDFLRGERVYPTEFLEFSPLYFEYRGNELFLSGHPMFIESFATRIFIIGVLRGESDKAPFKGFDLKNRHLAKGSIFNLTDIEMNNLQNNFDHKKIERHYDGARPITFPTYFLGDWKDPRDPSDPTTLKFIIKTSFDFLKKNNNITLKKLFFGDEKYRNLFYEFVKNKKNTEIDNIFFLFDPGHIGYRLQFALIESWFFGGSNILVLGENLQKMMEDVSVPSDFNLNDLEFPEGNVIYVALPSFKNEKRDPAFFSDIRGVLLGTYKGSFYFSVWSKPSVFGGLFEDRPFGMIEEIDTLPENMTLKELLEDRVIEDFVKNIFNSGLTYDEFFYDFWRAVQITINSLYYWKFQSSIFAHPDNEKQRKRELDLTERLTKITSKKKRRSLESQIAFEKEKSSLAGKWYYLEEEYTDQPLVRYERRDPDPDAPKKRSPRMHDRKGHWRTLKSGREVWVRSSVVNKAKNTHARYWKSIHD